MVHKLVVADWSPSVQKAIRMAFPEPEFEIHPFRNGIDVEEGLAQITPDAILLNLSLPDKDGYEIARFIKSKDRLNQIPLILLQGIFDVLDKDRLAWIDYEDIILEPFDSEKLVHTVRSIIEGNKEPQTLPEEPVRDEKAIAEKKEYPQEEVREGERNETFDMDKSTAQLKENLQPRIKEWIKQENLKAQKELEKRLKAHMVAEIKEYMKQNKKKS